MKKLVLGLVYLLVGLIVLVVAAAFAVPPLIDWNDYKADIADAVREATGRELTIEGDVSVALLPWPEASVEGVRLSNPGGADAGEMLSLRSAEAEIALWPLFGGAIEVESLTLVGADITLEQAADGSANWDFAAPAEDGAIESGTEDEGGDFDLSVDGFTIQDSRIRYFQAGEEIAAVGSIDAVLTADSLEGPFTAVGTAEVNGLPVSFDLGLGSLAAEPEVALRLGWDDGASELAVNGSLTHGGFSGQVALAAEDGRTLARAAGLDASGLPGGKLSAFAALSVSEVGVAAEQLAITLGDSRLTGHARLTHASDAAGATFDVALSGDQLNLDALRLVAEPLAEGTEDAEPDAAGGFALPGDIGGTLALDIGAVTVGGDRITDLALAATLEGGALRLDQAAATLPGDSRVSIDGTLSVRNGSPYFEGSADVASPQLRALLAWLGVDVAGMPPGALQSLSFGGGIAGGSDSIRLEGFSLALDDTQAAGSASLALSGKPSIALTATVDRLDFDRYMGGGGEGAADGEVGGSPLDAVNADVDLSFGTLSIGGNAYESVSAVASLQRGTLTVERLSGSGPGGTAFSLSGSVSDATAPAFALTFDVSHPNLQQLAVAFGMDGAGLPAAAMSAAGTAQSDGSRLTVTDLRATIGRSDVSGAITGALGNPVVIDAQLSSSVLDLNEVFPSGGGGGGGGRWPTEPIDLAALRGVNGEVAWAVGRLAMAPTGLDNAQLAATLTDGVLTITTLSGSIGGGAISVNGRIDASSGLGVTLSASANSVVFDPGVIAIGGLSIDGARIDFQLDLTAAGPSVADLIASMDGAASLAVGGGVINGLDLGAWQQAINGLRGGLGDGAAGLQGVLGALTGGFDQGISGGQTAIGALTGTFQINDGVVSTSDLTLTTDVAVLELDGRVSLPAWSIESLGLATLQQLVFDEVPSIPFRLGGTLDSPTFQPDFAALQVFLATNQMGLSLDQLPTDLLSGLPLEGLSGEALQNLDPQMLIDALSGQGGLTPEALQGLLGGGRGEGGAAGVPDPGALIEGLTGGDGDIAPDESAAPEAPTSEPQASDAAPAEDGGTPTDAAATPEDGTGDADAAEGDGTAEPAAEPLEATEPEVPPADGGAGTPTEEGVADPAADTGEAESAVVPEAVEEAPAGDAGAPEAAPAEDAVVPEPVEEAPAEDPGAAGAEGEQAPAEEVPTEDAAGAPAAPDAPAAEMPSDTPVEAPVAAPQDETLPEECPPGAECPAQNLDGPGDAVEE